MTLGLQHTDTAGVPIASNLDIDSNIFDVNRNYSPDSKSVFLLNKPGLLDSIHRPHPELFRLYKLLKSMDWDENEFQLMKCQMSFCLCLRT